MNAPRPKIRALPTPPKVEKERRSISPPLRKGVYILPNLFTTGGLFCGFYAIIATLREDYLIAAIAVLVAMVFDALDGRIARLTHTSSSFGVQYDSLSDLIAFGVAPGVLAYRWALEPWGAWGWLAAALYVTCGALRLARFNVQVEIVDKNNFVGLPIPAAAAVVAVTIQMYYFLGGEGATNKHLTLLLLVYALAALMVSTLPYYSFKGLKLRHRQPFWILIAAIVVIQMTIAAPQIMLFTICSLYALSGPVRFLIGRGRTKPQVTEGPPPEEEYLTPPFPQGLDSSEKSRL
ncbi:MAG: CDP-diacylglycerol--serine O-phosphatidyltransferase [Deltaproteobacteria bacterium]|nr:CDP-diacylglycerol--serine O-phosphatidyltransferase [Deltaproteobacteria bacterium]